MLGDNHRLRERLQEHGRTATAEVLAVKERPWANTKPGRIGAKGVYRLKLRVGPAGEPPFEVDITDEWAGLPHPDVGMTVRVLYDPEHHGKVVLVPGRHGRVAPPATPSPMTGGDEELDALEELEQAEARPAGGSGARLDLLKELADLHDRGVLSDDEFADEKAKILSES
jgi:hypothetical protein